MGRWVFSQRGKTSVQAFSNLLLNILTEGAVTTEAGSFFQYFTTLTEKGRPSPSAVARTLEYLVGVPSKVVLSGRSKNQVRINIQVTCEYLTYGYQVGSKSSPVQGMKAQALQSLFVGKVTNVYLKIPTAFPAE